MLDKTPVVYHGGGISSVLPAATGQVALGISDTGLIVVNSLPHVDMPIPDAPPLPPGVAGDHAFLWWAGRVKMLWPGIARAVNNRGDVAGIWDDDSLGWVAGSAYASELKSRAYLW